MATPSPADQARFVTNLQRLLTEGEFVSTYKYALLISLARWAIENPDHDDGVPLDVRALAPHFIELYWPHVQPFAVTPPGSRVAETPPAYLAHAASWTHVLVQDRGQKNEHQIPRVLKKIREAQAAGASRPNDLRKAPRQNLLSEVRRSIAQMPLWRLHAVRDSDSPMRFLYRQGETKNEIRFEDGMVGCLAHFAPLIEVTVRSAWLRFILRCNPHLIGAAANVESFLFPDSRAALQAWRAPLQSLQGNTCFYCACPIRGMSVVDHFLPWARYQRDLGHNFVLAHGQCNQDKSDHLASCEHLERWCLRNEAHGTDLAEAFDAQRLPHDWPTLRRVAGSLYQIAEAHGSRLWDRERTLVPIDPRWRALLEVA